MGIRGFLGRWHDRGGETRDDTRGIWSRSRRARAWDRCARRLLRARKPRWALALARRATALASGSEAFWRHRAAAAMRAGCLGEAALCYRALCRLEPDNPRAYCRLAALYDVLGASRSGLDVCRQGIDRVPDAPCLHRQLGRLLFNTGSPHSALRALERAAELDPQHGDTHFLVGLALRRAGRLVEARQALRNALTLRPDDPKVYYALGLCCTASEDHQESARLLLEGLSAEQLAAGLDPPVWHPGPH